MTGTVYGIGIGPGDPELITLKALRRLRAAPVLAYPAPETGDSLARAIAAPHLPGGQVEIAIRMPLSLERFPAQAVYEQATEELAAHLAAGRDVAVLCEGDAMFYGSFMYLYARLAARFPVEVIPGVSSLGACAARAGLALAARNDVLTVLPAPLPEERLVAALQATDAVALIKVGRHLAKVRRALAAANLLDNAHLVERATMAAEGIRPLAEVTDDAAPYFAMVLAHRRGQAWR
jgi:precorrin-2/cobalt-factor-2 C20-methyltransferase